MNKREEFIASVEIPNTAKVVKHVLKDINIDIEKLNRDELEKYIIKMKPSSPKAIITICYVLNLYAKWLMDRNDPSGEILCQSVKGINKKALWIKAKGGAKKKFISYEQYRKAEKQ